MTQENLNQMSQKSKKKIIIIVLICLLVGVLVSVASVSTNENKFLDKEYGFQGKVEQKLKDIIQGEPDSLENEEIDTGANTLGSSVAGALSYDEDYTVTTKSNVVYGNASGMDLKIDIYTPNDVSAPTPLVLYIHGGGFKGGNKSGVADDAVMLAKHGTAVVGIDYRLSGTAVFPAPLHDIKGVARYMKAHASEYNIDPNAFFTLGESAGGVLASLMGVTEGSITLEGTIGGNTGYDSNLAGVINISGSYVASIVDTMSPGIQNSIGNEIGCSPVPSTTCEDEYEALSPEMYINSGDTPFLILHGAKDQAVPTIQATTLDSKLGAVGVVSDIYIASDLAHVGGLLARYLDEVISFINTNS